VYIRPPGFDAKLVKTELKAIKRIRKPLNAQQSRQLAVVAYNQDRSIKGLIAQTDIVRVSLSITNV